MERYEERKVIGRGSYGTAHLVRDVKTGTKLVVKKIPLLNLTPKEKRDAESEVKFLSQLHHPNIVEYRDSFVQADTLHIVTQYCELGDLSHLIKQKRRKHAVFQEKQIVDWFIQIAMAVDHIHSLNIMHRDLKTGNVFLTKTNVVKLGDFGIAKVLNCTLDQAHTMVGTPYFMSPEVCENKQYDKKSDLWAMGCILYELCTLSHAFDASNLLGLVLKIIQESYTPIPNHYSPELRDLVKSLLSKNPSHRPSCRKIFRLPFIRNRLETLAKASTLGTTPDEKSQPIGTPPQNVEQDVPPPPPLPLAESETMPPPPPRVLPRNLMVNCPPKTSLPDFSKDATTEKDSPNKQPKVLGISRLQNGMREQSLTPSAMVKERKEAAIREREEILREANRKNAQSRLEARRRSGQQFQVSADNSLMGEGSEGHDCYDSSGVSNPEVSREQGFPSKQGESRHLMSPVATRHQAAARTPTTPLPSHYTDHQIMPQEDHFEMKTGDMHLHAKELNRAPSMTRRRSLGGAPYAGGTACNCNNCSSCISGRNGMPTPTPASASGEWNDSVQIGSARLPLTPGSIPRPQRRQRKPRSASGSCPASMLSSNQPSCHTRCHSTSGSIYQTNSHSSANAQVPTRRRSGSTVSMGAVSGYGNSRSPGGMSGMFGSPLHRSPMLQPNRRPRRIPENSRIKRSVLLNDPTPQQISAVAAAAAVHKATYKERQTHTVAIEHSKASPEQISSPRCRLAELEHQELERADALKVLDECKRRACNKELSEPTQSNAEITERERPPLVPSSSQQRPDWIKIAAKHRKRLVALLGSEDFQNIYTYLSNLHAAGRESSAKESRKELLKFVCKDKLALAFEVDQLLFMEGVHCQK